MLSKLRFFRRHDSGSLAALRQDVLRQGLGEAAGPLAPLAGGTLNVLLHHEGADGGRCFKTALTADGEKALRREHAILMALYPERLLPRIEWAAGRQWLSTRFLAPSSSQQRSPLAPADIARCADILAQCADVGSPPDGFADIIDAANSACAYLSSRGELSPRVEAELLEHLALLRDAAPSLPHRPCHGDLGPQNLLHDDHGPVLLDWEDALTGPAGYDWIYWLSFFHNRAQLDRHNLAASGLDVPTALAILTAILLVKCELALRTGAAAGHQMTAAQRLTEAMACAR